MHALSRQIAHGALFWLKNRFCRQYTQPQQVRQVTRIGFVATVFEAVVFRNTPLKLTSLVLRGYYFVLR